MRVEVRALGPVTVSIDGKDVSVGGPQVRRLVALLVVANGVPTSADRLIDALWHGRPPPAARSSLQAAISRLRKLFGADTLQYGHGGYAWIDERTELDTRRFDRDVDDAFELTEPHERLDTLLKSLAPWRGDAFEGCEDIEVLMIERHRLSERRLAAEMECLRLLVGLDRPADAHAMSLPMVESHPFDERLRALQMLALHRLGRYGDALAVHRSIRELLRDELGIEPGDDLNQLRTAIVEHETVGDGDGDGDGDDDLVRAGGSRRLSDPSRRTRRSTGRLVGRKAELGALGLVQSGDVALVAGSPGLGKSRLVNSAFPGATIVECWPDSRERGAPWLSVIESMHSGAIELRLTGDDADDVRTIADAWARSKHDENTTTVIENLHHADDLAALVLRRLVEHRLLGAARLVVTYRPDELSAAALRSIRAIEQHRSATSVTVRPLDGDAATALVSSLTSDDPMTAPERDSVLRISGGSPLLVEQVARLRRSGVQVDELANDPELVDHEASRLVAAQVDALTDTTRSIVELAALVGERFDLVTLGAVDQSIGQRGGELLDAALSAGLIDLDGPAVYRFSHALVRSSVIASIPPGRASRLHADIAEHLDGRRRRGMPVDLDRLSRHADEGRACIEPKALLAIHVDAMKVSHDRHDWFAAVAQAKRIEQVIDHIDLDPEVRLDLQMRVANAFEQVGDFPESTARFLRLAAEADGHDPSLVIRCGVGAAMFGMDPQMLSDEALELFDRLLRSEELSADASVVLRSRLVAQHIRNPLRWNIGGLDPDGPDMDIDRILSDARSLADPEVRLWALGPRSSITYRNEDVNEHRATAEEWTAHARAADTVAAGLMQLLTATTHTVDVDATHHAERRLEATAAQTRRPIPQWNAMVWSSTGLLYRAELDAAQRVADDAVAIGAQLEGDAAISAYGAFLLLHRWWTGRIGELTELGLLEHAAKLDNLGSGRAFALCAVLAGVAADAIDASEVQPAVDHAWVAPLRPTRLDYALLGDIAAITNDLGLAERAVQGDTWGRSPIVCSPSGVYRMPELAHLGRMDLMLGNAERGLDRIESGLAVIEPTDWETMRLRVRGFRCDALDAVHGPGTAEQERHAVIARATRLGLHGIAFEVGS